MGEFNGLRTVKAAPLNSLVQSLFVDLPDSGSVPQRVQSFLLTYRTYMKPAELLQFLTTVYHESQVLVA